MVDKPPEQMKPGEVPPGPWDPGLLKDDDGRWYLYWDSSNVFPIYGIEDRVRGRQADLQGQADAAASSCTRISMAGSGSARTTAACSPTDSRPRPMSRARG